MKVFPKDFMWGASTSAFQVEGAYLEDGKKLSMADVRAQRNTGFQLDTSVTSDHYHRWEEDVALMKELGLKSYRFSVNWTRIFPNGDEIEPNEKGIEFYRNLINGLIEAGIEPMLTMYHFDQPYGLIEKYGGWINEESIKDFVKYGKVLLDNFGDIVKYWFTINEQAVVTLFPDMLGLNMEDKNEEFKLSIKSNVNMWLAQAEVIKYAREKFPTLLIGPAVSYITTLPNSKKSIDMMAAKELEDFYSFAMMDIPLKGYIPTYYRRELSKIGISIDLSSEQEKILQEGVANFLGVNWYCTTIVRAKDNYESKDEIIYRRMERVLDEELTHTDWGWNLDPVGLRYGLRELMHRYGDIPIVITECGWSQKEELVDGTVYDDARIKYLSGHIEQMYEAIEDGVNLVSFSPWSFIDILSVGDGMEKRYGLIYVDRSDSEERTLDRYKKQSFYYYQNVIKNNAISGE